jgi:hypothetical protein
MYCGSLSSRFIFEEEEKEEDEDNFSSSSKNGSSLGSLAPGNIPWFFLGGSNAFLLSTF